jgi:hypothetical protein
MDPTTLFPKPDAAPQIRYGQRVVLLGSCFSAHLGDRLRRGGFAVSSNPPGTIFHPIPMARFLVETLKGSNNERMLQRDDVWLSRDAGSEVYAMSEEELHKKLEDIRARFVEDLSTAGVLVVTFGSAHGYCLKTTGEIVANCHKAPSGEFVKELTAVDVLLENWSEALQLLKDRFPGLAIVFTVSPVRYVRDGWTENNRSKARLFELTEQLQQRFGAGYFPSFELISDVLRDYRYFEADGVHPNRQAVDEVWKLFRAWYFDAATDGIVTEMEHLRKMSEHRLLFPESVKSAEFLQRFHEKRESFLSLHPFIIW